MNETPPPRTAGPAAVLVVEDERRMRELLCEVLPDMGFSPTGVRTAEEAQRHLAQHRVDVIILDLNLPITDGMSFLEQYRASAPHTPVIILTGFGDLEKAKHAIRLNVTEFLTKPCHLGEIEQALDRARRRLSDPDTKPALAPAADRPDLPADTEARTLAELERQAIHRALERHNGNRSAAAAELGISRRTLYNRLASYAQDASWPPG